jgi:hypothetical protein
MTHDDQGPDASRRSLTAMPTSEVTLRPSFIQELEKIAPKPQRSKTRYVVVIALLALLVWMAETPSVREVIVARGRQVLSGQHPPPAVDAPSAGSPGDSVAATLPDPPASVSAAAVSRDPAPASASPSASPLLGIRKPRRTQASPR